MIGARGEKFGLNEMKTIDLTHKGNHRRSTEKKKKNSVWGVEKAGELFFTRIMT